jgi:hypothetical protein
MSNIAGTAQLAATAARGSIYNLLVIITAGSSQHFRCPKDLQCKHKTHTPNLWVLLVLLKPIQKVPPCVINTCGACLYDKATAGASKHIVNIIVALLLV